MFCFFGVFRVLRVLKVLQVFFFFSKVILGGIFWEREEGVGLGGFFFFW